MLVEPEFPEQGLGIGRDDLAGAPPGEKGKHDGDQTAHDVGIRIAPELDDRVDAWVADRKLELLDCPYFQIVFTLPPMFYPLLKDNPKKLYDLLCHSVRDTLLELAG